MEKPRLSQGVYGKTYTHFQKLLKLYGSGGADRYSCNDPGIFTEAARRFHIGCVKEETVETADFGTLEDVPPSDKKDSGVTIDWKEGRVEFWRTEEKLRRENVENRPD